MSILDAVYSELEQPNELFPASSADPLGDVLRFVDRLPDVCASESRNSEHSTTLLGGVNALYTLPWDEMIY